jgi:hypothetical protein
MNIDLKKINELFSQNNLNLLFYAFLKKGIGKLLWFLFVLSAAYSIYLWYFFVYKPEWSVERKELYIKSKSRETVLDGASFKEVVNGMEARRKKYQESSPEIEDIFKLSN